MEEQWYKESVFYHIYPLGFCGAPEVNDYVSEPVERLYKISQWIPHMKEIGITALYLGPIFESHSHGYDTVDYYKLDRRLGTNETLKNVIKELHYNGIKVVLDGVFNHVSRDFFAFKDILKLREKSLYINWFSGINFEFDTPCHDGFSYNCWSGHYHLPSLNLKNDFVESHILNAITMWVQEFDIDGLRLDVADVLDIEFLKELSTFSKTIKKDFWLMGEVIHGDYNHWVKPEMLNSTTNYECYKGMYSSFNDSNFFEIAYSLNRLFNKDSGIYRAFSLYNFVDNHDVNRISSTLKNFTHIYPLHILLFSIPGIPSIYYGSEWGIKGVKEGASDTVVRPELDINYMNSTYPPDIKNVISRLSTIWYNSAPLKHGDYAELYTDQEQFAFVREYNGEKNIVILNSGDSNVEIELSVNAVGANFVDVLNNNEEFKSDKGKLVIEIPSTWGRILKVY